MDRPLRIALVYDCLFPWTYGGAERWYRLLAAELVAQGHEVSYLTRLQWDPAQPPDIPGVRVVAVSRADQLYGPAGDRLIGPPVRFGVGVARWLRAHRREVDVVHTCAFPYFSLLGVRAALAGRRQQPRVVVDWIEAWSDDYWRDYLGPVKGPVAAAVQRLCVALTPSALVYSDLTSRRLRALGIRGSVHNPGGLAPDPAAGAALTPAAEPPTVVFVGRWARAKRPDVVIPAVALARTRLPGLRLVVLGDGPLAATVRRQAAGLDWVSLPGFVDRDVLETTIAGAACLLAPSNREGFGIVVVEAAATGTPAVVAASPDNASVELVRRGSNGRIAADASPQALADAVVEVVLAGPALRASTRAWYVEHAPGLSARTTAADVAELYATIAT